MLSHCVGLEYMGGECENTQGIVKEYVSLFKHLSL